MKTFKQHLVRGIVGIVIARVTAFCTVGGLLGGAVVGLSSCNSYLDVNTDPTRPSSDQISLSALLPSIQVFTADAHARVSLSGAALWSQHLANQQSGDDDTHNTSGTDWNAAWSTIYLSALTNADRMVKLGVTQNNPHYQGVGKILQAINLMYATDIWENVPYSQAFRGSEVFTPQYDNQQQIYGTLSTLLREAVQLLQTPLPPGAEPLSGDLVYNGNVDNWRRLANTLLARHALHLSAKGAQQAGQAALQFLQAGSIATNAGDAQFAYTGGVTPFSIFRQNANELTIGRIFTVVIANYIVSQMNTINDPRLPLIARGERDNVLTTYTGAINGAGAAANGANTYMTPSTWYAANPVQLVTFSEAKFLEAEARFLAAGGTASSTGAPAEARTALVDAVRANMTKMGVAATAIDTYLQRIPPAAMLKLSDIMMEKYRALFLHPEVWVDMRRYNYDVNVYIGLQLPQNHNPDLRGRWIQRGIYPQSEQARNQTAFTANWQSRPDFLAEQMWRDRR